jgi:hypothetical protein
MAFTAPVITAYFDLTSGGGGFFTVEDPTLGALDTGGPLAGDIATDIDGYGYEININRGRSRELDEIPAGTCRINFRNQDRTFDPANAASAFYPNITPGKRISVSIYGESIFDGTAEDWENEYDRSKESAASVFCVDALGSLARKDFDEWTTTDLETAGERIASSLDRNEVVYAGGRDLDTGVEPLQDDLVTWGSNVLNYLQLVAKSDLGRLFASRSGVLTYRDRLSSAGSTASMTFADDGTAFKFQGARKRSAAELLYTRVGVDREGGTLQTSTDVDAVESYGVRTLSLGGLLLNTDTQAEALADFLLGIYKQPDDRVASISVFVSGYPSEADRATVSSLEIGDLIDLVWTPAGVGDPIEQTLSVEGVSHQISFDVGHWMTLDLSNAVQQSVFILDDPVYGILAPPTGGVLAF